jgi:hypothetical protein
MPIVRDVLAVGLLDDAGDFHELDPGTKFKRAGNERARNDENMQSTKMLHEIVGYGAASSQMSQPEGIVAVHEYACFIKPPHDQTFLSAPRSKT